MKQRIGIDVGSYATVGGTKNITISGLELFAIDSPILIVMASTGQTLYQFNDTTLQATITGTGPWTLTLTGASVANFAGSEVLEIWADVDASDVFAQAITQSYLIEPPTVTELTAPGRVTAKVVPGGLYTFCVSMEAVLGATANTIAACSGTIGSKVVTTVNTAGLVVGQILAGTGVSPGSYIVSIVPGVSFTMSLPVTAAMAAVTLNVTAGSFAGNFEASEDGLTWHSCTVAPKTYRTNGAPVTGAIAPGLWAFRAGPRDRYLSFNLTSIALLGALGNLSSLTVRANINPVDRQGGVVALPYVSYVAATAATFPTGIPIIMPVETSFLGEISLDLSVFSGTSQTITWRQSNDDTATSFQGLSSTATQVSPPTNAVSVTAAGAYRLAPSARYFYAAVTGGTAVTGMTIGGSIGRCGLGAPSAIPVFGPVVDSKFPSNASLADAFSNPSVTHIGADTMRYNGASWDRARSGSNAADGKATDAAGNDNCLAFTFGFNGSTWDRARSSSNAADALATVATGNINTIGFNFGFNGTSWDRLRGGSNAADAEATVATGNLNAKGLSYLFNGTTWDRQRGNWNTTTGDTGAKTTNFNGATQTNFGSSGAVIVINMGAVTGTTPSAAPKLQGSADGGTTWYDIPGATWAAITATGVYTLHVCPGANPIANSVASVPLPRTWRLVLTITGTTPSFTLTNVQVAYLKG